MDFGELQRRVFAAHGEGDYAGALELIDSSEQSVGSEHRPRLIFWRACFLSLDGAPDEALNTLEGALDEGIWWDPTILERDPDLEAARELAAWSAYRDRLLAHRDEVAAATKPWLLVEHPDQPIAEPCPAVVVLHHAWGSAARTKPDWLAVLEAGWVLAVAQSSQPAGTDVFVWHDYERSVSELKQHFATLGSCGVDVDASAVGGFSQGAGVGLAAVLSGEVPARRFAVQAPTFGTVPTDIEGLAEHPAAVAAEGYVVVGTADHVYGDVTRAVERLQGRVARCKLEIVEGVGHVPPPDFPDRLRRWLGHWAH